MKRFLILTVLFLLLPSLGWGATYYVRIVDGTLKYRSGAIPDASNGSVPSPNDINQMGFDIGSGHTVVFVSGTYSGTKLDATDGVDSGHDRTIRPMIASDPDFATYGGTVTFNCSGLSDHCFFFTGTTTISGPGIVITGADTNQAGVSVGTNGVITLNYVTLESNWKGFHVEGNGQLVMNKCTIQNNTTYTGDINGTGGSVTANYSVFIDNIGPIRHYKTTYVENNCIHIGDDKAAIAITGDNAQTATISNSMFPLSYLSAVTAAGIENSSSNAVVTVNNSLLLPNPKDPKVYLPQNVTFSDILTENPKFLTGRYPTKVVFTVDDWGDAHTDETITALVTAANARGIPLSIAVCPGKRAEILGTTVANIEWDQLQSFLNAGNEIGGHSMYHEFFNDEDSYITIQYVGGGSAASMTIAAGTLTIDVTGAEDDLSLDLSNANYNSLGELCSYIDDRGAYTCELELARCENIRSVALADVAGQDIKTASYNVLVNTTRFYEQSVDAVLTAFSTYLYDPDLGPGNPYVSKVWLYAGGQYSDTAIAHLKSKGIVIARSGAGYIGPAASGSETLHEDPSAFHVYKTVGIPELQVGGRGSLVTGTDSVIYRATTDHVSTNDDKPITGGNYGTYWEALASTWSSGATYNRGDHVIGTDGLIYKCNGTHVASATNRPITGTAVIWAQNWEIADYTVSPILLETWAAGKHYAKIETMIKRSMAAVYERLKWLGYVGIFYTHQSDMSDLEWGYHLDAVKAASIAPTTLYALHTWLDANADHKSVDEYTYYRCATEDDTCYSDVSDFRLQAGSPAINAGANAVWSGTASVTDFAGTLITDGSGNIVAKGGTVDIGAYEFKGGGRGSGRGGMGMQMH